MRQKIADIINVLFGFRKFITWLLLLVVAVIFRIESLLDGAQFTDLMKATFLGFVAGNGVEHLVSVVKEYMGGGTPPSTPTSTPQGDNLVEGDGQ